MEGSDNDEWEDRKRPALNFLTPDRVTNHQKKSRVSTSKNGGKFQTQSLVRPGKDPSMMFLRYNDEVHRSVDFCPLMQCIMDTWPVQRLRDIRQLGTTYLVYACANHNRFEHSVGVAYLAQEMCKRLQQRYKTVFKVTDKDVLCVTLAGLLHDIGHGPYSHLYESFRAEVEEDLKRHPELRKKYETFGKVPKKWTHEDSSLLMVDAVLESIGLAIDMDEESLDKPLKQIGDGIDAESIRCYWSDTTGEENILTNRDWIFVKECIMGKPLERLGLDGRIGRTDNRLEWLYDIVSNGHNGIDVDKVDYFARDERRTMGEAGNIDISIINEACIARAKRTKPNGDYRMHYQICYPQKCVSRIIEFFKTRGRLHEHVYQHKTTLAGSCMLIDIFKLADPYYLIPTDKPGVKLPLSRAFYNPHAYEHMRDSIVDGIISSTSLELKPARDLAKRYRRRQLYKLASEKVLHATKRAHQEIWKQAKEHPEQIVQQICSIRPRHTDIEPLTTEDIIVKRCSWHQGQKDKNPLGFVRFVEKSLPTFAGNRLLNDVPIAKRMSDADHQMLTTREFEKRVIRVFCRDPKKTDLLAHAFEAYWERCLDGGHAATPAPSVNFGLQFAPADASDEESNGGEMLMESQMNPVQLTQESGDEGPMSPFRSPRGSNQRAFQSPEIKLFRRGP